jgi:16S rRNA (uracil1498-N3)-methyltransferase
LFYLNDIATVNAVQVLPEESSKHIVQVLRKTIGETIGLTDGKGTMATAEIVDDHKKRCEVKIIASSLVQRPERRHTIAISLLKNSTRFEWFLEKAAELGVSCIVPLICQRTEKQHFRMERMKTILVSAMLQSQQAWITELSEPVRFHTFIATQKSGQDSRFIAHCEPGEKRSLLETDIAGLLRKTILVGPEGDFSPEEIAQAIAGGWEAVQLGDTRLRTETAGVIASALLQLG